MEKYGLFLAIDKYISRYWYFSVIIFAYELIKEIYEIYFEWIRNYHVYFVVWDSIQFEFKWTMADQK